MKRILLVAGEKRREGVVHQVGQADFVCVAV